MRTINTSYAFPVKALAVLTGRGLTSDITVKLQRSVIIYGHKSRIRAYSAT